MTIQQLSDLPDEQLRVMCAERCGPKLFVLIKRGLFYRPDGCGYTDRADDAWKIPESTAIKYVYPHDDPVTMRPAPTPNYPCCLNAMTEARKALTGDASRTRYLNALRDVCEGDSSYDLAWKTCDASARQHCIAFISILD